jgi:hypothetical protein
MLILVFLCGLLGAVRADTAVVVSGPRYSGDSQHPHTPNPSSLANKFGCDNTGCASLIQLFDPTSLPPLGATLTSAVLTVKFNHTWTIGVNLKIVPVITPVEISDTSPSYTYASPNVEWVFDNTHMTTVLFADLNGKTSINISISATIIESMITSQLYYALYFNTDGEESFIVLSNGTDAPYITVTYEYTTVSQSTTTTTDSPTTDSPTTDSPTTTLPSTPLSPTSVPLTTAAPEIVPEITRHDTLVLGTVVVVTSVIVMSAVISVIMYRHFGRPHVKYAQVHETSRGVYH